MSSYVLPCDINKKATWSKGSFTPRGNPSFSTNSFKNICSTRTNPRTWAEGKTTYSARLFVGFSVKKKPVYSMDYLVELVKEYRTKVQHEMPDASFVYQRGVYTHSEDNYVVTEDGAQIVIINLNDKLSAPQFENEMVDLADHIRTDMRQKEVILEIQKNGLHLRTLGIGAEQGEDIPALKE